MMFKSGDARIEYFGSAANWTKCVWSGSQDDALGWVSGLQGTGQFVFLQQCSKADNGIEVDNDSGGIHRTSRSHPKLYNVTIVRASANHLYATSNDGMRIGDGSEVTARNILITGFGGNALNVLATPTGFFSRGKSSLVNSIIHANGGRTGDQQIAVDLAATISYMDIDPMLVNVRWEASPDPRPASGSHAFKLGSAVAPPYDGTLNTRARRIGAFCNDENWFEKWTFFGYEVDYHHDSEDK